MKKLWRNQIVLSILTGIIVGTSYIPFPPYAALFAFLPLWRAWRLSSSWKEVLWLGWCAQLVLTLIGFNWVAYTAHEFGHLPWAVSIMALLIFASFASLHFPISGLVWWWLIGRASAPNSTMRNSLRSTAILGAAFILAENWYPMIFDWNLGYSWLPTGLPAIHLAEWIGIQGLSALVMFSNVLVDQALSSRGSARSGYAASWLLVILTSLGLGFVIKSSSSLSLGAPYREVQVGIVQANIGNIQKQQAEKGFFYREAIVSTYLRLTEELLNQTTAKLDFVLWPETAVPDFMDSELLTSNIQAQRIKAFQIKHSLPLVTGAYSFNLQTRQVANAIFALDASGNSTSYRYAKTHLLAFGEYLPMGAFLPFVKAWFPETADFERGLGPTVLNLGDLRLGPQICYEGLFPGFARGLARAGAQLIVNVTNDSWYGQWQEPMQHLYMTMARAIEIRRPIVRSTNTGISSVALASGEILNWSPMHEEWIGQYKFPVQLNPPLTVFTRGGFLFAYILAGLTLVFAVRREMWREMSRKLGRKRS